MKIKEKKMNFETIKYGLTTICTAIFAFLKPIASDIHLMLLIFGANALFGILADICHGKSWDKKKFQQSFVEALLFFAFVCLIYTIGHFKHNMDGALQCVSFVSYTLIYYYGTNICRNMMNVLPDYSLGYKAFAFIYSILSVEFIKTMPLLNEYIKKNKNLQN